MSQNTQVCIGQISENLQAMREQMKALYMMLNSLADATETNCYQEERYDDTHKENMCSLMESSMFSIQEAVESIEYATEHLSQIAI